MYSLLIILLTLSSATNTQIEIDLKSCWMLEKTVTPETEPIWAKTMECIPFISPDGRSGCYKPEDNEVNVSSSWTKTEREITFTDGDVKELFSIIEWSENKIVLREARNNSSLHYFIR